MSIQVLCPMLNCIIIIIIIILPLRCMSSLHILNIGKYFSYFIDFFFQFVDGFFCCAEAF